jgi:hypothetical protein
MIAMFTVSSLLAERLDHQLRGARPRVLLLTGDESTVADGEWRERARGNEVRPAALRLAVVWSPAIRPKAGHGIARLDRFRAQAIEQRTAEP